MIDTDKYEEMTWETPSDELEDAVENLLAEVKRLTALFEETNHHLDLMVEAFGIEALVELVGEEE